MERDNNELSPQYEALIHGLQEHIGNTDSFGGDPKELLLDWAQSPDGKALGDQLSVVLSHLEQKGVDGIGPSDLHAIIQFVRDRLAYPETSEETRPPETPTSESKEKQNTPFKYGFEEDDKGNFGLHKKRIKQGKELDIPVQGLELSLSPEVLQKIQDHKIEAEEFCNELANTLKAGGLSLTIDDQERERVQHLIDAGKIDQILTIDCQVNVNAGDQPYRVVKFLDFEASEGRGKQKKFLGTVRDKDIHADLIQNLDLFAKEGMDTLLKNNTIPRKTKDWIALQQGRFQDYVIYRELIKKYGTESEKQNLLKKEQALSADIVDQSTVEGVPNEPISDIPEDVLDEIEPIIEESKGAIEDSGATEDENDIKEDVKQEIPENDSVSGESSNEEAFDERLNSPEAKKIIAEFIERIRDEFKNATTPIKDPFSEGISILEYVSRKSELKLLNRSMQDFIVQALIDGGVFDEAGRYVGGMADAASQTKAEEDKAEKKEEKGLIPSKGNEVLEKTSSKEGEQKESERLEHIQAIINQIRDQEKADLEKKYGTGKIGEWNQKLNESKWGKALSIGGKIIGGTTSAISAAFLTGGLAAPAYMLGTKMAINGLIEGIQYFTSSEEGKRALLEEARLQVEDRVRAKVSAMPDILKDPEQIRSWINAVKEEELKVLQEAGDEFKNIQSKNALWRGILSSTGTIGIGVMTGVPLGMQDLDADGVYNRVRAGIKGFEWMNEVSGKTGLTGFTGVAGTGPAEIPSLVGLGAALFGVGRKTVSDIKGLLKLKKNEKIPQEELIRIQEERRAITAKDEEIIHKQDILAIGEPVVESQPAPADGDIEEASKPQQSSGAENEGDISQEEELDQHVRHQTLAEGTRRLDSVMREAKDVWRTSQDEGTWFDLDQFLESKEEYKNSDDILKSKVKKQLMREGYKDWPSETERIEQVNEFVNAMLEGLSEDTPAIRQNTLAQHVQAGDIHEGPIFIAMVEEELKKRPFINKREDTSNQVDGSNKEEVSEIKDPYADIYSLSDVQEKVGLFNSVKSTRDFVQTIEANGEYAQTLDMPNAADVQYKDSEPMFSESSGGGYRVVPIQGKEHVFMVLPTKRNLSSDDLKTTGSVFGGLEGVKENAIYGKWIVQKPAIFEKTGNTWVLKKKGEISLGIPE